MPLQTASDTLQQYIVSLVMPPDQAELDALRERVCLYVDDRKRAGWPPERVIVAVKHIARQAGLSPSSRVVSPNARLSVMDDMLVQMVGWCIQRYYNVA